VVSPRINQGYIQSDARKIASVDATHITGANDHNLHEPLSNLFHCHDRIQIVARILYETANPPVVAFHPRV
jgi:hypothetical protein